MVKVIYPEERKVLNWELLCFYKLQGSSVGCLFFQALMLRNDDKMVLL